MLGWFLLRQLPGAYKHMHHEVAEKSIKLTRITGSNCCRMPLCAFTIVLTAEALVSLQKQMAKYTRKLKMM